MASILHITESRSEGSAGGPFGTCHAVNLHGRKVLCCTIPLHLERRCQSTAPFFGCKFAAWALPATEMEASKLLPTGDWLHIRERGKEMANDFAAYRSISTSETTSLQRSVIDITPL